MRRYRSARTEIGAECSACRRGFTLIEMLVVIAVSTLVMIAVATTLHALTRTQQRLRADMATAATLERFSSLLRRDCHSATAAILVSTPAPSATEAATPVVPPVLRITRPGGTVEYQTQSRRMLRVEFEDSPEKKLIRREVFEFTGISGAEWVVDPKLPKVEWRYHPVSPTGPLAGVETGPRRSMVAAVGVGGSR